MLKVVDLSGKSFPPEFLAVLPTHCVCGAETEITESLTILICPNKQCLEKAVQRMTALLKDIGVKNMGESKCRKFLEAFDLTNAYAIFMYEPKEDGVMFPGCSMDFSLDIVAQVDEKRKMLLWEFLKIGNMPGIRDSARRLAANYDNLEELLDDVEAGGVPFVQELLSIKGRPTNSGSEFAEDADESVSVKAIDVFHTLMAFKADLLQAVSYVDIITVSTETLNICISTAVGEPYKSKTDFITQMNNRYGSKIHLNFLSAVTKDCNYLIWSKQGSATNKVEKAEKYGIEILTGAEFEKLLSNM